MAEVNYNTPSNSLKNKQPLAPVNDTHKKAVVSGNVVLKEKTRGEKLRENGKNALKNVMTNTVAPSIKDLILNAIWNGLSMIFFPDGTHRPTSGRSPAGGVYYGSGYTSYSNASRNQQPKTVSVTEPTFRNPLMASIQDANAVIDAMRDCIATYGFVTWADLYDLCGMDSQNWQGTTKYGWTSVESTMVSTVHTANGEIAYELRMPKASPIDDTPF